MRTRRPSATSRRASPARTPSRCSTVGPGTPPAWQELREHAPDRVSRGRARPRARRGAGQGHERAIGLGAPRVGELERLDVGALDEAHRDVRGGEALDVAGAPAQVRLHRLHDRSPIGGRVERDLQDRICAGRLLGAELQAHPRRQARCDLTDSRAAGPWIGHEAEMRAVEREVGAGIGREPSREREVAFDDGVGRGGVVEVLAEEVDGRVEALGSQPSHGGERSVLVEPCDVSPRVAEGDVAGRRRGQHELLGAVAGREAVADAPGEAAGRGSHAVMLASRRASVRPRPLAPAAVTQPSRSPRARTRGPLEGLDEHGRITEDLHATPVTRAAGSAIPHTKRVGFAAGRTPSVDSGAPVRTLAPRGAGEGAS